MATPRTYATPTAKNNSSAPTPTRAITSPRVAAPAGNNRPLSSKSPSMRTPASGHGHHGHSHNLSTSSYPSSTPMAAPAIVDDMLALNSPAAALIASLGVPS